MANLKNITELPVVESADSLNFIVNDNGVAKQIAASEVGAQADWSITDESSPAFVKNKPTVVSSWNDLADKPFGEEETVIFQESVTYGSNYTYSLKEPINIEVGTTYAVTIDGIEYNEVAYFDESDSANTIKPEVNGYFMYLQPNSFWYDIPGTYEIKIATRTVKTIDEKYLPDNVPTLSTAKVGQTVVVKAIDGNGKPTEWECVDVGGSGGGGVVHVRFFVARVDGNLVYTCDHTESEIYELIKNGDNLLYATVESPGGGEIQVTSGYFYYATHTYSDDDNATFVNPYSKSMLQVSSDGNVYSGKLTA